MRPERHVRHVLKKITCQHVIRTTEKVWVISGAVKHTPEHHGALATCLLRGWVENLHDAVPAPHENGGAPVEDYTEEQLREMIEPLYRLTGAGWDVVHRRQAIMVTAMLISAFSASMGALGVLVAVWKLYVG
jgi:hypothetical protein